MPKVIVSPLAQADIDEIWDYIARDSLVNEDRVVDRIEQRFGLLAANPRLGVARDDLRRGLRRFRHARYMIYYRFIPGGIEVVRVVHGEHGNRSLSGGNSCEPGQAYDVRRTQSAPRGNSGDRRTIWRAQPPGLRGEADAASDIDFLVELEPGRSLFDLGGMLMDLQEHLRCKVDVLTPVMLKSPVREQIFREALPL
jgi:plasmid stabilization system protein ParE